MGPCLRGDDQRAVYRSEDEVAIPLKPRRPRERLRLNADGSADFGSGPDDPYIERPADWQEEGGVVIRERSAPPLPNDRLDV
jgi:hypothetical protein